MLANWNAVFTAPPGDVMEMVFLLDGGGGDFLFILSVVYELLFVSEVEFFFGNI